MNDQTRGLDRILEAAVHEHISARCRPAYFHDVRSGLQAIHSSIELMTRSAAAAAAGDNTLARKACEFAKRAVATHESTVTRLLDDLIAQQHAAESLDLLALTRESVQFLHSMAGARDVSLSVEAPSVAMGGVEGDLIIVARRRNLRMAILGLIWHATKTATPGSRLRLTLEVRDSDAWLRFMGLDATAPLPDDWSALRGDVDLDEWILPVASRAVTEDGGRMSVMPDEVGEPCLTIIYPLVHPLAR